jgi:hypothetical protein
MAYSRCTSGRGGQVLAVAWLMVLIAASTGGLVAQEPSLFWESTQASWRPFSHSYPLPDLQMAALGTQPTAQGGQRPAPWRVLVGTGLLVFTGAVYGGGIGYAAGSIHETSCFGNGDSAAEIGSGGGMVVGFAVSTVFFTRQIVRPQASPSAAESSLGLREWALFGAVAGSAIGAVGGAIESSMNAGCGGMLRSAGEGALLYGLAGILTAPLIMVLPGGT